MNVAPYKVHKELQILIVLSYRLLYQGPVEFFVVAKSTY